MFQLFLLSILVSPLRGIADGCRETQFVDKLQDPYPKPGVLCSSSEAEDRWRGELIYENLEDSSGIRVKWKHILQRSDCWGVEVKFYVNNRYYSRGSHAAHRNMDWVEIQSDKTFELKIQALYQGEPRSKIQDPSSLLGG